MNILSVFGELLAQSGFAALTWQQAVMLLISFILLYLAIKKQFEPLLLLPKKGFPAFKLLGRYTIQKASLMKWLARQEREAEKS